MGAVTRLKQERSSINDSEIAMAQTVQKTKKTLTRGKVRILADRNRMTDYDGI